MSIDGVSEAELKNQMILDLEKSGTLDAIRSQLRMKIFQNLQGELQQTKPNLTNKKMLTASIVSEWLLENG
jgi:hypothetical protein